jgi:hypothetical protein
MYDGWEEMKAQVGSLASGIEEMRTRVSVIQYEMEVKKKRRPQYTPSGPS